MAERVFSMPDLGEGLEEGIIVEWLVAEGDTVELNQPMVEVETAKASVEIPSPHTGQVRSLHGVAGAAVAVGAPLVTFDVEGRSGPVAATPPVRRLARELGVDLDAIDGTGPHGRVQESDIRASAEGSSGPGSAEGPSERRIELDAVRRGIAATMTAQAAIPQVTTFRTVDCTELQRFRADLGVSPLPVVVAALCRSIAAHPMLNARWAGDHLELRNTVNVGIAVDTERGLVVPVLRQASGKSPTELAAEITRLATAARAGALTPEDVAATATIAVSNTGSYGSESGTPILSPGTSVTLGVGVIGPRALVVGDDVKARPACTLSLTFDHRVLDGAAVGAALTDLVARLQSLEGLRDLAG
jgi:2-oxoisovalerate dehydrogenase E2 component (dihydrolipoyl transacylase)